MQNNLRILLCKGGMDGHTRPVRILARSLRDAGFDVILTDAYQSPAEICAQAIQEDPEIIGVSIHTRGHNRVFSAISKTLKEAGVFDDFALVAGGVITEGDYKTLNDLGVCFISSPGDSIADHIIPRLKEVGMAVSKNRIDAGELYSRMQQGGDTRALARFITLLANGNLTARQLLSANKIFPDPMTVGLSGSGGVGKSSLIGKLVNLLRKDHKLGVLCVDPCSASGGAVLGDRIRFQTYEITTDPNVYIRSLAARKVWRGVTRETPAIIKAMKIAGREIILVESVGSGQIDVGFKRIADTFIYVASPDMGDEMQMLKGGAIETADIIALNKADKDGVLGTEAALLSNFGGKPRKDGWTVPIIKTVSSDEKNKVCGIEELWEQVERHQKFLKEKPKKSRRTDRNG